jgi:hypothetical protein
MLLEQFNDLLGSGCVLAVRINGHLTGKIKYQLCPALYRRRWSHSNDMASLAPLNGMSSATVLVDHLEGDAFRATAADRAAD